MRGRPLVYLTDEDRAAAKAAAIARAKAKTRNVTLDEDMVAMISALQDRMEVELGFRPNQSQALRRVIALYHKQKEDI